MTIRIIFLLIFTFIVSWSSVGVVRRYFQAYLLDVPNERSSHTQPTPRSGGIGFLFAVSLATI